MTYIVHIDDDQDDLQMLATLVKEFNPDLGLESIADPLLAIDFLNSREAKPDLIFLDINMPKKNGFELMIEFKQDAKLGLIPVIFYSTSGTEIDIHRAKTLGAIGFLKKENSYARLQSTIADLLIRNFDTKALIRF